MADSEQKEDITAPSSPADQMKSDNEEMDLIKVDCSGNLEVCRENDNLVKTSAQGKLESSEDMKGQQKVVNWLLNQNHQNDKDEERIENESNDRKANIEDDETKNPNCLQELVMGTKQKKMANEDHAIADVVELGGAGDAPKKPKKRKNEREAGDIVEKKQRTDGDKVKKSRKTKGSVKTKTTIQDSAEEKLGQSSAGAVEKKTKISKMKSQKSEDKVQTGKKNDTETKEPKAKKQKPAFSVTKKLVNDETPKEVNQGITDDMKDGASRSLAVEKTENGTESSEKIAHTNEDVEQIATEVERIATEGKTAEKKPKGKKTKFNVPVTNATSSKAETTQKVRSKLASKSSKSDDNLKNRSTLDAFLTVSKSPKFGSPKFEKMAASPNMDENTAERFAENEKSQLDIGTEELTYDRFCDSMGSQKCTPDSLLVMDFRDKDDEILKGKDLMLPANHVVQIHEAEIHHDKCGNLNLGAGNAQEVPVGYNNSDGCDSDPFDMD